MTSASLTKTYVILENGLPMDGDLYTHDRLMKAILYADYDAEIAEFDMTEFMRDGSTPMRKVTEDITVEWWSAHDGERETYALVAEGKDAPGLASRFFSDEVARMEGRVERAA